MKQKINTVFATLILCMVLTACNFSSSSEKSGDTLTGSLKTDTTALTAPDSIGAEIQIDSVQHQ
jgi:hypothetical protein